MHMENHTNNQILEIYLLIGIFITLWPLVPSGNVFNNWLNIIYYIPLGFYLTQDIDCQIIQIKIYNE